jgi:hypothetical protein
VLAGFELRILELSYQAYYDGYLGLVYRANVYPLNLLRNMSDEIQVDEIIVIQLRLAAIVLGVEKDDRV